jgi:hypothetical protein
MNVDSLVTVQNRFPKFCLEWLSFDGTARLAPIPAIFYKMLPAAISLPYS